MLQFGLRAHDFGKLPPEQLADALAVYKPATIQLALAKALAETPSKTGTLSPGYARRIKKIFDQRNISIAVLGCYINPVHPDPDLRDKALRRFEEHLRFCRDFGCAMVGTETGSCNPDCSYHPDTASENTFNTLCDSIERLLKTAESYGSIVAVEAVAGKHTIDSIEKMKRLLDTFDSPNLQVIYDPVNLIPKTGLTEPQDVFFQKAFNEFGDRIVAVHAKDFVMQDGLKKDGLPAGTGQLDYTALFKLLVEHKPYIDVLLENSIPEKLTETFAFLDKTLSSLT